MSTEGSNPNYFWSSDQIQILTRAYEHGEGLSEAEKLLPEKKRNAIAAKACRMGITKQKPRRNSR